MKLIINFFNDWWLDERCVYTAMYSMLLYTSYTCACFGVRSSFDVLRGTAVRCLLRSCAREQWEFIRSVSLARDSDSIRDRHTVRAKLLAAAAAAAEVCLFV